jgi:DNA-binding MarR family transcriptional regulator
MKSSQLILDNIRYIIRALRISSRVAESQCGLSTAQLFVLRALEGSKGMSINELASRTLTHQSSVSAVVKHLEDRALVLKRASKKDSRSRELTLTKKGKMKVVKSPPLIQQRFLEALSEFSESDRKLLARLLSRFVKKAGLIEGTPPLFFEDESNSKRKS